MASVPAQGAFGFQSDLTDASTGQVDMGVRAYEPTLGRFSSPDLLFGELTDPISLNRYLYGGASPITYADPTGLMPVCGEGCTRQEEADLIRDYAASFTQAGASEYSPALDQPAPPPAQPSIAVKALSSLTSFVWSLTSTLRAASTAARRLEELYYELAGRNIGNFQRAITYNVTAVALGESLLVRGAKLVRAAGWVTALLASAAGYAERRAEGEGPYEAGVRQGLELGGGVGGSALGAAAFCTASLATGPASPLACGAAVIIGGLGGSGVGDWLGDVLFGDATGPAPLSPAWFELGLGQQSVPA
jgi:RHS repeat-associated protein